MSVINKMLRDLDSRQAAGASPVQPQESRTGIARGTLIVNDSDRAGYGRGWPRIGFVTAAAIMVLGGAAGAWRYRNQSVPAQLQVDQARVAPRPAAAAPVIVVATGAAPMVPVKVVEPIIVANPASATVDPANTPQKAATVAPPAVVKLPMLPLLESGAPAAVSLKMDSTFKSMSSPATSARSSAVGAPRPLPERILIDGPTTSASTAPAAAPAVPQSPLRQSPALEALAQAQSLWSSGSHEAAIDFLREALAVAERANLAGMPSGNNSVLASLARELARMELAEGRVSQTLEMLARLEPALSGFPDVWALRGNAAQRLGRHQESAAAYLMALKLRPEEPRWMLGAAVSLAAQGQTAAAAELAEKARAGGVLSREVAAYLRQLGVPLRER